jgi:putative transposase
MGHPRKNLQRPCCYHVTHRCHDREFLLKFRRDRRNYVERLRQASRHFGIDVLTYMVTGNHVHLLVWAERADQVSSAMHFLQGTAAGDYIRRKGREGAFWRGRYRPTLVESGHHLSRCLLYVDLNMVRARVCDHPEEWVGGAFREHLNPRHRYRVIALDRLLAVLGMADHAQFVSWYTATIREQLEAGYHVRKPFWSSVLAVGTQQWVRGIAGTIMGVTVERVEPLPDLGTAESPGTYVAHGSTRTARAFWEAWSA